jgi:uncharacterized protein YbjT (DUF2867 family)
VAAKVLTQTGHENKLYSLTGPELLTTSEVTAILSRFAGREIKFIDIPEENYAQMVRSFGVREETIQKMLDLMRKWRLNVHDFTTQDVEKITGKKPILFEQFAIDHAYLLRQSDHSRQEVLAK